MSSNISRALPNSRRSTARVLGITGHQRLDDEDAWPWVDSAITKILSAEEVPPVGTSSLAIGADQLFARAVLRAGGAIHVVIPFAGYALRFSEGENRQAYETLLARGAQVEVLKRSGSDQDAYMAAGRRVVDISDVLIAVWDGKRAKGLGGTADVVAYAKTQGKPIVHINPGARTCIQIAPVSSGK